MSIPSFRFRVPVTALGLLTVTGALCLACSPDTSGRADEHVLVAEDEADEPQWEPGEEEAVIACASEKLGYELTRQIMDAEYVPDEGPIDTEEEWERQRWMRAHGQCMFELRVSGIDMDDMGWQIAYRHAYALDPDGNPAMDDPLAPWSDGTR